MNVRIVEHANKSMHTLLSLLFLRISTIQNMATVFLNFPAAYYLFIELHLLTNNGYQFWNSVKLQSTRLLAHLYTSGSCCEQSL